LIALRNAILCFVTLIVGFSCVSSAPLDHAQVAVTRDTGRVRRELEKRYDENIRAFLAKDLAAIMALRTEDFHAVTPDGVVSNRAQMEERTRGFLNGIDRWIATTMEIDSLEVSGDLARAVVRQHADRMALRPDGKIHHVETWVTQNEMWRSTALGWKLYRVDSIRDQRRTIDGQPD
jgi:ketosteroid isomerase-like protein